MATKNPDIVRRRDAFKLWLKGVLCGMCLLIAAMTKVVNTEADGSHPDYRPYADVIAFFVSLLVSHLFIDLVLSIPIFYTLLLLDSCSSMVTTMECRISTAIMQKIGGRQPQTQQQ